MANDDLNLGLPESFDLDAWIDGTCALTKIAKIYQKGDLLTKLEKIEQQIKVAKEIRKVDRSVSDQTPESLQAEWDAVAEELSASALLVHVQDRTESRRRRIRDRLVKEVKLDPQNDDDAETITLHQIADAIVRVETPDGKIKELPDGFPVNKLRELIDRVGDAALNDVWRAYSQAISEAPHVAAPLSRRSSSHRGGVT